MKFWSILTLILFFLLENLAKELKCDNGGCYEVIKTFVELLEQKINATDIVS